MVETKWRLHTSMTSPFGRKVRIAAPVCGFGHRIEIVPIDAMNPDPSYRRQNPLAKIPALVTDQDMALYDSRVILEWLDEQAGGGVILPNGRARFEALRLQALADGIGDALLLLVYERRLRDPEMRSEVWIERQKARVAAAMSALENGLKPYSSPLPNVGEIALSCMLGLGDSHFQGTWRRDYPRLVDWLARFAEAVPSFNETIVPPVPN